MHGVTDMDYSRPTKKINQVRYESVFKLYDSQYKAMISHSGSAKNDVFTWMPYIIA